MVATLASMAPAKLGATVVPVKSYAMSHGILAILDQHSGNEYPTLVKVPGADPKITLSIPFLEAYNVLGLGVNDLTTFEFFLAKFSSFARAAGSVHTKWALSASAHAAVQIAGWSVDLDGDLMASVEVVPLAASATAHPLTKTNNNALLSLGSQPTMYTLGPMEFNGTVISGLMSAGVDLGQSLVVKRHDGDLFARVAARLGATPKMTGEHGDPINLLETLTTMGLTISSTVKQYYRKYDPTTGVVSGAAGDGISVSCSLGRVHPTDLNQGLLDIPRAGIEVYALSSTSTHPFTISTSATVPAT